MVKDCKMLRSPLLLVFAPWPVVLSSSLRNSHMHAHSRVVQDQVSNSGRISNLLCNTHIVPG